ncbi:MAG: translocation/assembly module TamB domain-containing protein [Desulfobacterales bacterium]|nr:translocation/assembly module TamB domain-containing protein [Desulfobacterales bacterium]
MHPSIPSSQHSSIRLCRIRRLLKSAALLCLAVLFCGVAALALLQTETVRSGLKSVLLEQLSGVLNATVEIGRIEGDFIRELTLEKVRLSDPDGDILSCDRLSLKWLMPLLLKKTIYIQSAEIHGLHIQWRFLADGSSNFTRMFNSDAESAEDDVPSAIQFILGRGVLKDSGIAFIEQKDDTVGPEISVATLALQLKYGRVLRFDIEASAFSMKSPRLPETALKGIAILDPDTLRFRFETIDVKTCDSSVHVAGEMSFEGDVPAFDLALQSERLNLGALDRAFDLQWGLTGTLAGEGTAKGDFDRFEHQLSLTHGDAAVSTAGTIAILAGGEVDLAVTGSVREWNPAGMPFYQRPAFAAGLNADFSVKGKCGAFHPVFDGTVEITMHQSELASVAVTKGYLAALLSGHSIAIRTLLLDGNFGAIQAGGELAGVLDDTGDKTGAFTVSWSHSNPAACPYLEQLKLRGNVNLELDLTASFPADYDLSKAAGKVTARLKESRLKVDDLTIGSGEINAVMEKDRLTVKDAAFSTSAGGIVFSGMGQGLLSPHSDKNIEVSANLQKVDPGVFLRRLRDQGEGANVNLSLDASAQLPSNYQLKAGRILFNSNVFPSVIGGMTVNSGGVQGEWMAGKLRVDRVELTTGDVRLHADGEYDTNACSLHGRAQADVSDLKGLEGRLKSFLPEMPTALNLSGRGRVTATASGAIDAPDFSIQIDGTDLSAMGLSAGSIALNGKWQGVAAVPRQLSAVLKAGGIDYKGNRFPELNATVNRDGESLSADIELSHESKNVLTLIATAEGLENETKSITIKNLSLSGPDFPESEKLFNQGPILLRLTPQLLAVDALHVTSNRAELTMNGLFAPDAEQRLAMRLSGLEMARLSRLWNSKDKISGLASANVSLSGTLTAPVIEGRIGIKNIAGYQVTPADLTADIAYRNGAGTLKLDLTRNGEPLVAVAGSMTVPIRLVPFEADFDNSPMRAFIKVRTLLSALPIPAIKEVTYDAFADMDLNVAGKIAAPEISGHIRLLNGHLAVPGKGLNYDTVSAEIDVENRRIFIRELLVKGKKEGYLRGAGQIEMDGFAPAYLNLQLTGEKFYIPYQKAIQARLTPELTLAGPAASPVLTGEIRIVESKINLDKMAPQAPPEILIVDGAAEENRSQQILDDEEMPWFLKGLSTDVLVHVPGNAWLKGQDINTELTGEIALKKTKGKPFTLIGELSTIRGTYNFRGRLFKIEQGGVRFIGLEDLNPLINLKAVSQIDDADIIILLTGRADKLVLTLDSDPKMDQSDIISYLVFGKSTDSLKGGQAFNAEKAAMSLSGGMVANELRSILGDVFFLDSFAIESGEESAAGAVSFGKYLRPKIFVLYRQGLAEDQHNRVEISYELSPNIRVETQLGNDRNNGVDLFWEYDF